MTIYYATLVFVLLTPPPSAPPGLWFRRTILWLHLPSMSAPPSPPAARCPPKVEAVSPCEPFYTRSFSPPPSSTAPNPNSTLGTTARHGGGAPTTASRRPHRTRPLSLSHLVLLPNRMFIVCVHMNQVYTHIIQKNGYRITNVIIYSIYYRIMSL
jgi:hypothetical protein